MSNGLLACAAVCAASSVSAQTASPGDVRAKKPAARAKSAAAPAAAPTIADLAAKLDALAQQNAALQAKVERLEAAQAAQPSVASTTGPSGPSNPSTPFNPPAQTARLESAQTPPLAKPSPAAQAPIAPVAGRTPDATTGPSATTVSAYGEIGYSHPTKSTKDTQTDVQRAVIGLEHRFDDRTRVVAEFEWEHAIASSGDSGEAEVEQLWVEREFAVGIRGRAGLFLMPVGLINQNHEPTAYFGVYRPDVDTKIVPSTWREAGLGVSGDTAIGLNWDVAVTTMPNLSKWDPASTEGRDRGPLQAIHGEGQFAASRDLGGVVALNWRGIPGLLVGGSLVYGGIGQHQPGFLAGKSRLTMFDLHARYQIAGWDLAGEYIRGNINDTEALNASYAASSVTAPTLVPKRFYGGYVQAAYTVWRREDYALIPFVRYERLNTAAGFGGLSVAAGGVKQPDERIWTLGASLRIGEGVVLKADYRDYRRNKLADAVEHFNLGNSVNLGVGFAF